MIETRYISEIVYVANAGYRYWFMREPEVCSNGSRFFSINEHIYKSLFYTGPVEALLLDGKKIMGIWRLDKKADFTGPKPFPGFNFKMYWYSTSDLIELSPEELDAREESIFKCRNMVVPDVAIDLVKKFW